MCEVISIKGVLNEYFLLLFEDLAKFYQNMKSLTIEDV